MQLVMVQYRILLSNIHFLKEIKTFILNYLDKLVSRFAVLGYTSGYCTVVTTCLSLSMLHAQYVGHWTVLQKLRQRAVALISAAQFLLPLVVIIVPITLLCFIPRSLSLISCLSGRMPTLSTWPSFLLPFIPRGILSETNTACFCQFSDKYK